MFTIARLEPVPHWHPLRIAGRRLSQRSCSARAGRRDDRLRHGSAQRQTHGADWREPAGLPIQGHFAPLQDRSRLWAPPCSHLIVHATGETEAFGESTDAGRRLKYRPPPNPREPLRITAGEERFAPAARRRARAAPAPNLGARIVVGGHAGQRGACVAMRSSRAYVGVRNRFSTMPSLAPALRDLSQRAPATRRIRTDEAI